MRIKISIIFILILIPVIIAHAQNNRVAQSGMTFLIIDVGARPSAMGGSFVCMDNDANALFWNPAGIAKINGVNIVFNETSWLAGMNQFSAGCTFEVGRYGVAGLSFLLMDNPEVHVTTIRSAGEMWFDEGFQDLVNQYAIGFAFARQITTLFSIGGQIKWIHEDFGTFDYEDRVIGEEVTGWKAKTNIIAYDFGTQYYAGFKDLRLALSIRNFAPRKRYQLEYFELPLVFQFGMAMDIFSVIFPAHDFHTLNISIDALHPRDYSERMQIGGEYWFRDTIAIRSGYKFNHDLESFSAGIGIRKSFGSITANFDYSYSDIGGIFNDVQRLSFGISF
jgi:hypothetical protein